MIIKDNNVIDFQALKKYIKKNEIKNITCGFRMAYNPFVFALLDLDETKDVWKLKEKELAAEKFLEVIKRHNIKYSEYNGEYNKEIEEYLISIDLNSDGIILWIMDKQFDQFIECIKKERIVNALEA